MQERGEDLLYSTHHGLTATYSEPTSFSLLVRPLKIPILLQNYENKTKQQQQNQREIKHRP